MYGGVYKRDGLPSDVLSPEQIQYLKNFVVKRAPRRMNYRGWSGLKDPYDPRFVSLFILTDSQLPRALGLYTLYNKSSETTNYTLGEGNNHKHTIS